MITESLTLAKSALAGARCLGLLAEGEIALRQLIVAVVLRWGVMKAIKRQQNPLPRADAQRVAKLTRRNAELGARFALARQIIDPQKSARLIVLGKCLSVREHFWWGNTMTRSLPARGVLSPSGQRDQIGQKVGLFHQGNIVSFELPVAGTWKVWRPLLKVAL